MAKRKTHKVPVAVSIPDDIKEWDREVKPKAEKMISAVEVTAKTPAGNESYTIPIMKMPPPWTQPWLDAHRLKVVYAHGEATLAQK
jgi:hypothetical protein